jgi:hypothetical protein
MVVILKSNTIVLGSGIVAFEYNKIKRRKKFA